MAGNKKTEKLTIEKYKEQKARLGKRWFKIEFYPWPILLALGIPLATLIFLIIVYILHIRGVAA